jgi:hypothetical protein
MSKKGLARVSKLMSQMQELRIDLLILDRQDCLLGQCLEDGKNAMQDKFLKATMEKTKR